MIISDPKYQGNTNPSIIEREKNNVAPNYVNFYTNNFLTCIYTFLENKIRHYYPE